MAISGRAQKWMKLWVVLAGLMFFGQCALQSRPYLSVIFGDKKQHATQGAEPPRSRR
jgi:hypothetical protein